MQEKCSLHGYLLRKGIHTYANINFWKSFIGNYFSTSILIYITPSCSYQIPLHDILVVQKMWQKRKEVQK